MGGMVLKVIDASTNACKLSNPDLHNVLIIM